MAVDGLGLVSFDATMNETIAILTEALGPPDFVGDPIFQPGLGTLASAAWGELWVDFQGGNELYFAAYEVFRPSEVVAGDDPDEFLFELSEWTPSDLAMNANTQAGVRIGTSAADAATVYPTVYAPRCGASMEAMSLTDDHDTIDQLFVEPEELGLYLRAPIDGLVWSIGAQVRPNPMLCDGGQP